MTQPKFRYTFTNHAPVILTLSEIESNALANLYLANAGVILSRKQFTGILDQDKQELFDGDQVENDKAVFEIIWSQQNTSWWLNPIKSLNSEYADVNDWTVLIYLPEPLGNGYLTRRDLRLIK